MSPCLNQGFSGRPPDQQALTGPPRSASGATRAPVIDDGQRAPAATFPFHEGAAPEKEARAYSGSNCDPDQQALMEGK